jgi:hypothetical protein
VHPLHLVDVQAGATPLYWACSSGLTETAELLLDRGAEVNAGDKVTPCCWPAARADYALSHAALRAAQRQYFHIPGAVCVACSTFMQQMSMPLPLLVSRSKDGLGCRWGSSRWMCWAAELGGRIVAGAAAAAAAAAGVGVGVGVGWLGGGQGWGGVGGCQMTAVGGCGPNWHVPRCLLTAAAQRTCVCLAALLQVSLCEHTC